MDQESLSNLATAVTLCDTLAYTVDVDGITVTGPDVRQACGYLSMTDVNVTNTGELTLQAGRSVALGEGFRVQSGGSVTVLLEVPEP